MYGNDDPQLLKDLIVDTIDISDDDLLIRTKCGRSFEFYHRQNCCESVSIYDTVGDLKILENKQLVSVSVEEGNIPEDVNYRPGNCSTWTEITFKTTDQTVISRWIGESNGYYSESVDFREIK